MAKLADVASEIRVILKFFGILLAVIILGFVIVKGGQIAKSILVPTPPAVAEEKFGTLPAIAFPAQNPVNLEYQINTLTGKLPTFDFCEIYNEQLFCKMKVYKVKAQQANLVALKRVREQLQNVSYISNEAKIDEATYRWNNPDGNTITYNIISNNFKITSDILNNPPGTLSKSLGNVTAAFEEASRFLETIGIDDSDLDPEKTKATFLKIENGQIVEANSQSNSQFIRVDLYQKDIGESKIYYPTNVTSPMHFIFKSQGGNVKIVDASFTHSAVDTENTSTYNVKTTEQAFEYLKSGEALIFNSKPGTTKVDITDVSVGYYIGNESQEYILPIYVFAGDGFLALVNAISQ